MIKNNNLNPHWRALAAETIGTALLVFVDAGGAAIAASAGSEVSHEARAIATGLTVAAIIYTFGARSGAHINPAITLAFAARGSFPWRSVPAYWVAQFAGAALAAALIGMVFGQASVADGVTQPNLAVSAAFVMEVALTFMLATVVLGTAIRIKKLGAHLALASGAIVMACVMFARPVSDASMNPARSFGPALVALDFDSLWIYLLAPALGALLATLVARLVHGPLQSDEIEAAVGEKNLPAKLQE